MTDETDWNDIMFPLKKVNLDQIEKTIGKAVGALIDKEYYCTIENINFKMTKVDVRLSLSEKSNINWHKPKENGKE